MEKPQIWEKVGVNTRRDHLLLGLTWPGGVRDRGMAGRSGVLPGWNLQCNHPDIFHSAPLSCSSGSAMRQKKGKLVSKQKKFYG